MEKLYTYYPEFDDDDCLLWHVYENATRQIVASFLFEDDALEYMRFVEHGGAFHGFTPSFMLQRVTLDINQAFASQFA
jgi:hypothetical protein